AVPRPKERKLPLHEEPECKQHRPGAWATVWNNFKRYLRKDWSTKTYVAEDAAGRRYYGDQKYTRQMSQLSFAQLTQNSSTEQRAPHVATTGSNQPRDKPQPFPGRDDLESAPGAKKSFSRKLRFRMMWRRYGLNISERFIVGMVLSATMRLLLVVFALLVLNTAANDDEQSGTAEPQGEEVPPFEEDTTGEPETIDEANVTDKSAATGGKRKEKMITYQEVLNLAKTGHHLMIAYVIKEGNVSQEYIRNIPEINKVFEQANVTLRIYWVVENDKNNTLVLLYTPGKIESVALFKKIAEL
ncbi:hypothetical protein OSTOST_07844, partial [Ostertagia ostertagi]